MPQKTRRRRRYGVVYAAAGATPGAISSYGRRIRSSPDMPRYASPARCHAVVFSGGLPRDARPDRALSRFAVRSPYPFYHAAAATIHALPLAFPADILLRRTRNQRVRYWRQARRLPGAQRSIIFDAPLICPAVERRPFHATPDYCFYSLFAFT